MTNLDYVKSLNASDFKKFFEDFFNGVNGMCRNCPISSICSDIPCMDCIESLNIWFEMERIECKFKDLKVGDKFKNNGDIYIKTANGYAFNIQTGEGCFCDTETEFYKVADIEVKEKE